MKNNRIVLIRRPRFKGLAEDEVSLQETDLPEPDEGQVRVRTIYLSIDPTIRLWLNADPPVITATPLNTVVPSVGIGVIDKSRDANLPEGSLVSGMLGWQQYCICPGRALQQLSKIKGLPLTAHLSLLGSTGLTAYFGLLDLGRPREGDTVLVSGAAGAVGSLVGQIAKIHGCRVVGIAGGADKCHHLISQLGFDDALDYRKNNLSEQLPLLGGVDIFFDNIGGPIREAGMLAMKDGGRIVVCGEIASDYKNNSGTGIVNSFLIVTKALQLLGLRVDRYFRRADEAFPQLADWALSGRLQHPIHLHQGLESAPQALNQLFTGANLGKAIVQVSPDP